MIMSPYVFDIELFDRSLEMFGVKIAFNFFGVNWSKDMYDFIDTKGANPEMPRPLKEILNS
jgi:hypothetical protein